MQDINSILAKLFDVVRNNKKHKDYKRTVELATLYRQIITNEDTDGLFKQINRRESKEWFEQRKRITNLLLMPISNFVISPKRKVARSNDLLKIIELNNDSKGSRVEELENILYKFAGDDDLDKYIKNRMLDLTDIDPNAWLVTEWDTVEKATDKRVQPYPYEVYSHQAVDFEYLRYKLQYLIVETDKKYTFYGKDQTAIMTEIKKEDAPMAINEQWTEIDGVYYIRIKSKAYAVVFNIPHNLGYVPAKRCGYLTDKATDGRTFVNVFHVALPFLLDTVKAKSEKDLTFALHTFPIRLQYEQPCPECTRGISPDGLTCKMCNGTGTLIATSTQETITMPMPKHKDDLIPLEQLLTYVRPPADIIGIMIDNLDKIQNQAYQAVWGREAFSRTEVVGSLTATEMKITESSKYDQLFSCAEHLCGMWTFVAETVAKVTNIMQEQDLIFMTVGKEFNIKSKEELTVEYEKQKQAGMSATIFNHTEREIVKLSYDNEPMFVRKYDVQNRLKPFADKTADQVSVILSNRQETTLFDRVLYQNYAQIWLDLELEHEGLYDKPIKEIRDMLTVKTDEYIKKIKSEQTRTEPLNFENEGS